MSGGHFEYKQHHMLDIADEINRLITHNGKIDEYGCVFNFNPETVKILKKTAKELTKLEEKVHDIDWFVSGDTGEEDFIKKHGKKK